MDRQNLLDEYCLGLIVLVVAVEPLVVGVVHRRMEAGSAAGVQSWSADVRQLTPQAANKNTAPINQHTGSFMLLCIRQSVQQKKAHRMVN